MFLCSSAAILCWDSSLLKSQLPGSELKGDFLCTRPVTLLLRRAQVFEQSSLPETLCKLSWNGSTKITRKFNIFAHNLWGGMIQKPWGSVVLRSHWHSTGFISSNHFGPFQNLHPVTTLAADREFQEVLHRGSHHDYLKYKMSMAKVKSFLRSLIYTSPEEPALFTLILNQHRVCKRGLAEAHVWFCRGLLMGLEWDARALTDLGCNAYHGERDLALLFK